MGDGYGSEWHLLRYLGRHREALNRRVLEAVGATSIAWRDHPVIAKPPFDEEWKNVDFLPEDHPARRDWLKYWPQTGNVPNWDAVASITVSGREEWLLVEAKARVGELEPRCLAPGIKRKY